MCVFLPIPATQIWYTNFVNKNIKELLFLHFLNDGARYSFALMLPFIAKDLSLNLTHAGFLGATQPFLIVLVSLPAGFIAASLGGFRLLVNLLFVYAIGALIVASAPNLLILIPGFLLGAAGFGMFHTVGYTLIARNSEKEKVDRNMGDFTSIGDIGRILLPPLLISLIPLFGWRVAMVVLGVVGFISFFIFRFFVAVKDEQPAVIKQERFQDFFKQTIVLFKKKRLLLGTFTGMMDGLASSPIYLFLPFLLLSKGINTAQLAIITACFFAGSIAGKNILGRLVDMFGNRKVFILSEISMAASIVLLVVNDNFLVLLALSILLGIFTKGTISVIQAMLSTLSDKSNYNKMYGMTELLIGIACVAGEIGMGFVGNSFGVQMIFYACAALGILAILPALFAIPRKIASSTVPT